MVLYDHLKCGSEQFHKLQREKKKVMFAELHESLPHMLTTTDCFAFSA